MWQICCLLCMFHSKKAFSFSPLTYWLGALPLDPAGGFAPDALIGSRSARAIICLLLIFFLATPLYSSTSGRTRRSYIDRSWQSWYVGSEDHYEPLIVAGAGRTSMPGMMVPSGVDIWTRANIVWTRFAC